jgi:hypothetical protein
MKDYVVAWVWMASVAGMMGAFGVIAVIGYWRQRKGRSPER